MSRVTFQQAEENDLELWRKMSVEEKLSEIDRLRKEYWGWKLGSFPQDFAKVVHKRLIYDI